MEQHSSCLTRLSPVSRGFTLMVTQFVLGTGQYPVRCATVNPSGCLSGVLTSLRWFFSGSLTSCTVCWQCFWSILQDNFLAAFMLGWGITIGAGLASYPIDTVRRRMMMTSGQAVKYKSSIDCFQQVRERGSWGVVPDSLTSQGAITLPSVWFRGTAGRWAWCLGLGWAPVGACRVVQVLTETNRMSSCSYINGCMKGA
jgi:hypothetical protein